MVLLEYSNASVGILLQQYSNASVAVSSQAELTLEGGRALHPKNAYRKGVSTLAPYPICMYI